jgi:peptidyl-prolyl cis-trans isomerase C
MTNGMEVAHAAMLTSRTRTMSARCQAFARCAAAVATRHRALQFLVLGGLLFALAPKPGSSRDIGFESRSLSALEAAQVQRLGRAALDGDEAREVQARAIQDEILYREALRLGLDRDDNVVRQRLIQKVLFLAEDLAGVTATPSEAELRAFFDATRSQWTRPARVRFVHVYAGPTGRDHLADLRDQAIAATSIAPGQPPSLGDAFPLPRSATASHDELVGEFGAAFADAVFALRPGTWSDPIPSRHGWHLVEVVERTEAGLASFEEVQGRLPLTYLVARKKRATADFLRQAATRYRITIDGHPLAAPPVGERMAPARDEALD